MSVVGRANVGHFQLAGETGTVVGGFGNVMVHVVSSLLCGHFDSRILVYEITVVYTPHSVQNLLLSVALNLLFFGGSMPSSVHIQAQWPPELDV